MDNEYEKNVLYSAIATKNVELVKQLVKDGIKIDLFDEEIVYWFYACDPDHPLGLNYELINILLESGVDINTTDQYNQTVLDFAVGSRNNVELARYLLQKGATLEHTPKYSEPLIISAARNKNLEMVKLLLEYGANPNARTKGGEASLIFAANEKDYEMIKLLVENGADINITSENHQPVLFLVQDDMQSLQYLLNNGADPDVLWVADIMGKKTSMGSLLLSFCRNDDYEKASLFLQHGSNPNIQNETSKISPLHWAAKNGNLRLVKLLITHGADPKLKTIYGLDAELIALQEGHHEIHYYLAKLNRY